MTATSTLLILAGEASGDHHGAALARALKERIPGVRLKGLGGPLMEQEGVELLAGLDRLAVMGFAEVIRHLAFFRGLMARIRALLASGEIDLMIPVDYPGFNLRASRVAHGLGVPVLYYVAPQVWAWKPRRARQLAEYAHHVAVILPFEEEVLQASGARVSFVGHPLLERPVEVAERNDFCAGLGLDPDRPILGLLPGSRRQEVERHLELFVDAARRVKAHRPSVQTVLARATSVPQAWLASAGLPVTSDARALQRHARVALVKSGTSTLETALEGTPFVVAYRTHPLTFALARRLIRVPHVALANLVAGEEIVPELLQGEATAEALAEQLLSIVDDGDVRDKQLAGLARIRGALGSPGASKRVANLAAGILEERA